MHTHHALLGTLALATLALTLAGDASATTITPAPNILPVVWPLSSTTAALNVTFSLHDCTSTSGSCATQAVTSGTTPTFTVMARSAGAVPVAGITRAMILCGGASANIWCYNETVQFDQAVTGPYVAYGGVIMWSLGVSPANAWQGQSFVVPAREVRLTSSINDADLPEGRAHANATWESAAHASTTYCILNNPCDKTGYEGATHANSTWESQAHANVSWESQGHANASWEGQPHANITWESQPHANDTWESRPHANSTWCPTPCVNASGDYVSNPWFNGTFRPNANFGSVTMTTLSVGTASAGDVTISGAMTTQTALDPYVLPLVFGGLTVFSTAAGLWISRKPGIVGKLAIGILLVVATVWAAGATVSSDANAFRWVAVIVTAGWALLVIFSMKGQGVRR